MAITMIREQMISRSEITPNPDQPRKLFDPEGIRELSVSLAQHGILQPIVVRPRDGAYQIIAGERRWRASEVAGLELLPCRVLEGLSDEEAFILSVTENVARRDMTIIEEANAFAGVAALGRTPEEVADLFGKSETYVSFRLSLLNLREDLQELAAKGQIATNLAWYISRLSLGGQARFMAKYVAGELKTEYDARRFANALYEAEQQTDLFAAPVQDELALEAARARRSKVSKAWEKLDPTRLGQLIDALTEMTVEDLAAAMGPDLSVYQDRMRLIEQQASKARRHVAKARAHYLAREGLAPSADADADALDQS